MKTEVKCFFQNARKNNRWKIHNYSECGLYFVTICTRDKKELFGSVHNEKMELNYLGKLVEEIWKNIPNYYKEVEIDEFIVMPNHIHGIIDINHTYVGTGYYPVPTNNIRARYGLLSKIVKSFKHTITNTIRRNNKNSVVIWQRSFYDHIIRIEEALNDIRNYIINNPPKWEEEKNILINLKF